MDSSTYTYLLVDLLSGEVREELPVTNIRFSSIKNGSAGFDATLPLWGSDTLNGYNKVSRNVIQPASSELWVLRDGVPLFSGIIWGARASAESRTVTISGKDHLSYLERRFLNKSYRFTDVDQFSIINTLFNYMKSASAGDIGLSLSAGTSGVTRTRTWYSYERRRYADILSEMADLEDGFDYAVDFAGSSAAGLSKKLTLSNRRGRRTAIAFELGKNVELLDYTEDGLVVSNQVTTIGAGEGTEQISSTVVDAGSLNSRPLLEMVAPFKTIPTVKLAKAKSKSLLHNFKIPVETVTVRVVSDDPDSALGSFITGDDVRVFGRYGYIDLDDRFRIEKISVSIDGQGKETVDVAMTPLGATI